MNKKYQLRKPIKIEPENPTYSTNSNYVYIENNPDDASPNYIVCSDDQVKSQFVELDKDATHDQIMQILADNANNLREGIDNLYKVDSFIPLAKVTNAIMSVLGLRTGDTK